MSEGKQKDDAPRVSDAARVLAALWVATPVEARAKCLRALELSGGNAVKAAALLDIGQRTLVRYMKTDAGLRDEAEKIRRRNGGAT